MPSTATAASCATGSFPENCWKTRSTIENSALATNRPSGIWAHIFGDLVQMARGAEIAPAVGLSQVALDLLAHGLGGGQVACREHHQATRHRLEPVHLGVDTAVIHAGAGAGIGASTSPSRRRRARQ